MGILGPGAKELVRKGLSDMPGRAGVVIAESVRKRSVPKSKHVKNYRGRNFLGEMAKLKKLTCAYFATPTKQSSVVREENVRCIYLFIACCPLRSITHTDGLHYNEFISKLRNAFLFLWHKFSLTPTSVF